MLFLRDAEPLFLVDDDPGPGRGTVRLWRQSGASRSPCRFPALEPADDVGLLLRRAEAGEQLDFYREAFHAAQDGLTMLPGQDRRAGTKRAHCLPSVMRSNAARRATSVFPNPTSPQSRRSIRRLGSISALISSVHRSWSLCFLVFKVGPKVPLPVGIF